MRLRLTLLNLFAFGVLSLLTACHSTERVATAQRNESPRVASDTQDAARVETRSPRQNAPVGIRQMLDSATEQTRLTKSYDPAYVVLPYPNGDVPVERGVCTDVVIRAMRRANVDLQKEVHEDMRGNFAAYPKKWGLKGPDKNIDHRRVPNLTRFFARKGKALPVTDKAEDYQPGDIVAWKLDNGLDHIGLVSDQYSNTTGRYLIVHNIGRGAQSEDVLFEWKIVGHYRYF